VAGWVALANGTVAVVMTPVMSGKSVDAVRQRFGYGRRLRDLAIGRAGPAQYRSPERIVGIRSTCDLASPRSTPRLHAARW
jgi:hypothetical protein